MGILDFEATALPPNTTVVASGVILDFGLML
jgi:hypothetical protein